MSTCSPRPPHTYHVDIGQMSTSLYYYEDFNRLAHAKSLEDSLAISKACVCYVILIIIIIYGSREIHYICQTVDAKQPVQCLEIWVYRHLKQPNSWHPLSFILDKTSVAISSMFRLAGKNSWKGSQAGVTDLDSWWSLFQAEFLSHHITMG